MDVKWTEQQKEAVMAPVSNILVTAAAGAGKTQVLTGRILQRILGGADITRMLIVTFTNAAAAEMKGRISKALSEESAKNPQNEHIKKQLMLMPLANIQTIHSFCLDTIKNNFFKADISPDFKIADDAECKILKADAMEEALESLYEEGDSDFLYFTDSFSDGRSDRKAEDMIFSLFDFAESMPFPKKWLCEQMELYDSITKENFEKLYFTKVILKQLEENLTRCRHILLAQLENCTEEWGTQAYEKMILSDIEGIDELLSVCNDWDALSALAKDFSFMKKPIVKGGDEEIKKIISDNRDSIKKQILKAILPVSYTIEENVYIMNKTSPALKGLVKSTIRFSEKFEEIKREKNLLDFSDIEHVCINLLTDEEICEDRKNFFEEIYVDEYQDSNSAQDFIFKSVSREDRGEPNVFMVGDVKQSIYGFRQTNPGLFLEKKDTYKFGDSKNRKIVLGKNFRSSENVINYINTLFEKIMCRSVGGVDYDEEERLIAGAKYPEKKEDTEIDIINMDSSSKSNDALEAEAVFIAKRILTLIREGKVYDLKSEKERSVRFSDIAILMRSPKNSIEIFERVFKDYDIPLFADYEGGGFESAEVRVLLSLLGIIDNPENDIPLISVLRSQIGGFDENELAQIRLCMKNGSFYEALCKCKDGKLGEKCIEFVKMLERFRKYSKYMPCHTLIETVLSESGYEDAIYSMPASEGRMENIKLLTEQARNYENSSYRGLYNFISYINNVKERSGNLGAPKSVSEALDVVKIMSIHKSKGLEFPIVILAGCGKKMNTMDLSGNLILHRECGIGISYCDRERRVFSDTPLKMASRIQKEEEELSEEIRVLYVALTRAKEKLIITATVKDADKAKDKWLSGSKILERNFFIRESSYIDYIMAVYYYCLNTGILGTSVNIVLPCEEETEEKEKREEILFEGSDERIKEMLSFSYPHGALWEIPSKVTVTELKRIQNDENEHGSIPLYVDMNVKVPRFIQSEGITPARRGQLMHFVMQSIDIMVSSEREVKDFVMSLKEKNIITEEEANAIDCRRIAEFFTSPLGERMKNADAIFREEPFAISVPASMITGRDEDFSQKVMVQGIIDCYFFEGDSIILLDYKTDKNCEKESIIKNYKKQLEIYGYALEKKYLKKIYEKFIYLFHNGGIIDIG